jgi:hypothetical protein
MLCGAVLNVDDVVRTLHELRRANGHLRGLRRVVRASVARSVRFEVPNGLARVGQAATNSLSIASMSKAAAIRARV